MSKISISLAIGATGLGLVALSTAPSVLSLASNLAHGKRHRKTAKGVYRDKDGISTEEETAAFSTKFPKTILALFAIAGAAVSTTSAVLSTLHGSKTSFIDNWLNASAWYLLVFQSLSIALEKRSVHAFNLGVYGIISSILLFVVLLVQDGILSQQHIPRNSVLFFALTMAQLGLSVCTGFAFACLPRRPNIFIDDLPVDAMYTTSAFGRYSFSWCAGLLKLARENKTLELEDFPRPNHYTRSKDATNDWLARKQSRRLWIQVIVAHWPALATQWTLTLVTAFGTFGPQWAVLQILRILEKRTSGQVVSSEAWVWVAALGLVTIAASWAEAWLYWISWSGSAIPVRSQLSTLIFQKSMRRKDVKGKTAKKANVKDGDAPQINAESGPNGETTAVKKEEVTEEEEEDDGQKSKQGTVNLIGVDCKRVSDFCSFNNLFPGSLFKLIISFAFLLTLIGWKSLLSGLVVMGLLTPVNIFFSKRYASAQDRLMKIRDVKMGVVTEALQGIRQIKFSALEDQWQEKIGKVRTKELAEQWRVFASDTMLLFCWIASPIMLAATSLAVYAIIHGELTPSVAFTAIGVFRQLEVTLSVIPELTTDLIDAWVSIERIEKYLESPEVAVNTFDAPNISFENASIAWPSDEEKEEDDQRYVLRNVNISFPEKELSVISGKTGTGKSLLLASILGEVDVLAGKISVPKPPSIYDRHDDKANADNWIIPSSVAFVAQIPWIENASIKDNILFGLPYDDARYKKTIEVCALKKDLEMLTDGERTEIGANGINLSGGQRWRVTFARALYSRAGILVLDDIFSAVDATTGRFLFEKALCGPLSVGRTRILVTHHVGLCKSKTKYIVELGEGTVENSGLVAKLEEDGLMQQILNHENAEVLKEDEEATAVNSEESSDAESTGEPLKKTDSKGAAAKFVEEEAREKGSVKKDIYFGYLSFSGGWSFWLFAILVFFGQQALTLGRTWWLRIWTGSYEHEAQTNILSYMIYQTPLNQSFPAHHFAANLNLQVPVGKLPAVEIMSSEGSSNLSYYLGIYIAISVAGCIVSTIRFYWIFSGSIRASRQLFDRLSFTVLRTPLRWVDTVPLGRILNRFTADFNIVDSRLAHDIAFGASSIIQLAGVIIAGLLVSPFIIVLALILLVICLDVARRYLAGAREVKRLESTTKSPIFEQFGSVLTGVGTIRAFDKTATYVDRMYKKIDDHSTTVWYLWLFNRWMGYRMSMVGAFFATIVAAFIITVKSIDASLAGFALAFSLEFTGSLIWSIRHYANMELDMNAAERILEYSDLKTESLEGIDPPASWPSEGRLEVNELIAGYSPELPPVLKGLTFSVARNERIGVVGRTGAGKSSLTLALFRFLEAREGTVYIDGLDISKIKLHELRSRLAIIPQDPVLFSGTVRSNLDAFDQHTDTELRDALSRVHLISALHSSAASTSAPAEEDTANKNENLNLFENLSSVISEGGLNLSQGQRQLLCLARAIVSRPKIMVLDEATSAVDMGTDALIQRSIREEFTDSTLIVIAHRLSTIGDFDKILVMDDGKVGEFGTPRELLELGGIFANMVGESGEKEKLKEMILSGVSN